MSLRESFDLGSMSTLPETPRLLRDEAVRGALGDLILVARPTGEYEVDRVEAGKSEGIPDYWVPVSTQEGHPYCRLPAFCAP